MNDTTAAPEPETKAITVPKPPIIAGAKPMGIIPQSIEEVARVCKIAVDAGLMGKPSQRESAEQKLPRAMMIVMQGLELGITPMQALNGMANINGKTGPYGKLARSLVLRRGHKIEETFVGTEYEPDFKAVCKVTRGDNGTAKESSFSVKDAIEAGLWQTNEIVKKKDWDSGKMIDAPNDAAWFRFRKDMLAARAFSRAANIVADALMGMELAEVLRDVEEHRSDREEDRGKVSAVAAPPPPLADDAEYLRETARKPPETDPERVEPEKPKAPPTPAEEKVPEHAGPDMEAALARFAGKVAKLMTGDELEQALADFEREFDGHITSNIERALLALVNARLSMLGESKRD